MRPGAWAIGAAVIVAGACGGQVTGTGSGGGGGGGDGQGYGGDAPLDGGDPGGRTGGRTGRAGGAGRTGGAPNGGGGSTGCSSGFTLCGSSCIYLGSDPQNCGKCGNACRNGESCSGGTCTTDPNACKPNETQCGGLWGCVDLDTNPIACGSCTMGCPNGEQCQHGKCAPGTCWNEGTSCPDTYGGATCVTDFLSDWGNCGACGVVCGSYESCEGGQCVPPVCDRPYTYCEDTGCTDTSSDIAHCGGCSSCPGGYVFDSYAYTCASGKCGCSAIATPCGDGCAARFSYCPAPGAPGTPAELCSQLARNAYDRCACNNCLGELQACAGSPACVNAMDCSLNGICVGCPQPFPSCTDQFGRPAPLADELVACMNTRCQAP